MSPDVDNPALYGSTSRLVLLQDNDEDRVVYTDDVEDDNEEPQPAVNQLPIPPLTRSVAFLYLLSPYLRLGAIRASTIRSNSLTYTLAGLVVAAALSAFCRQIWFLLGRHLRTCSTEDILIFAFARRHRRRHKYGLVRYTFTTLSALFSISLAAMYLRDSVHAALLLKFPDSFLSPSRLNISIALSILVFVLSLPKSLASKSIVYTTGLSILSYLAWLVALSRSYGTTVSPSSFPQSVLWTQISSVFQVALLAYLLIRRFTGSYTFACTTAMTVPLSGSLLAGMPPVPPISRNARTRSFGLLNVFSTMLAALLIFPLMIIVASPRASAFTASPDINLILGLRIATLVFALPSVIVSTISLPLYGAAHRFLHTDLALSIVTAVILALSLVPPAVASILDDVMLSLAVFGSFLLPALAHITIHYFRRPLTIVMPQEPSSLPSTPRSSNAERSPSPSRDPLLQRKERHLQRRRLGKRLLWDIVVWFILIPMCFCALVWAVGRLAQQW